MPCREKSPPARGAVSFRCETIGDALPRFAGRFHGCDLGQYCLLLLVLDALSVNEVIAEGWDAAGCSALGAFLLERGAGALGYALALPLRDDADHVEHRAAGGAGRVERFGRADEVNLFFLER